MTRPSHQDNLGHRVGKKDMALLRHHGKKPAQLSLAVVLNIFSIEFDFSPPLQNRRKNFQQSGFPRTVVCEDTDHLAALDREGDAIEHGLIFVSKSQVVGLNRQIHEASFLTPSR